MVQSCPRTRTLTGGTRAHGDEPASRQHRRARANPLHCGQGAGLTRTKPPMREYAIQGEPYVGLRSARPLERKALMTRKRMVLDRQGRRAPLARAPDQCTGATISTESFCLWRDGSVVMGVSQFLPNRDQPRNMPVLSSVEDAIPQNGIGFACLRAGDCLEVLLVKETDRAGRSGQSRVLLELIGPPIVRVRRLGRRCAST